MSDFNDRVIAGFRANEGRVGGNFEGAPMVLVHHTGRRTGRDLVPPMTYLAPVTVTALTGADRDRVYAEQARRYPGVAEYEQKTAGIRTIPVLAPRRS